jgi:hypothetical protein
MLLVVWYLCGKVERTTKELSGSIALKWCFTILRQQRGLVLHYTEAPAVSVYWHSKIRNWCLTILRQQKGLVSHYTETANYGSAYADRKPDCAGNLALFAWRGSA